MARRGRKRNLEKERLYWDLLASGAGTVEACRQVGIGRRTGLRWRRENGGIRCRDETLPAPVAGRYLSLFERERARDQVSGDIRGERTDSTAEREQLVADIPTPLLTLYDKLRAQLGGVGAGALRQGRCEGCRLAVGAAELARMRSAPSDEVLRCEECNRILVRTSESGL